MLGTVGKIVNLISDPQSMLSAADTTAQVTSNSKQMPTENQEKGSDVLQSMGQKMKNMQNENPQMLVDVTSSMLGTVGNVFSAACGSVPIVERNLNITLDLVKTRL